MFTVYIILALIVPAICLRFFISGASKDNFVFNYDVDSTICAIFGLASMLFLVVLVPFIIAILFTNCTLVLVGLILSILSINTIITRFYMPKIIHLFFDEEFEEEDLRGIFYFIGLVFMITSGFWLPVAFLISSIFKQVTTQNYFYKMYIEQKNKEGDKE